MFHRASGGVIRPQSKQEAEAPEQAQREANKSSMDQSAVRRFDRSREWDEAAQSANQNSTMPYAVKRNEDQVNQLNKQRLMKEANPMNNSNAQPKDQSQQNVQSSGTQPQGRVDIPGNNFQRPGMATQSRPSYPGASYPGTGVPSAPSQTSPSSYIAPSAQPAERKLHIGVGITMSGEIESCDHLVVEGTVEAALKGASVLDIAEQGAFYGTVEIDDANIAGRFEGDITVNGRLTIEASGVIIGSVSYKELSMEAGATLDGSVSPIGSQNAQSNQGGAKKSAPKAKKAQNGGAELPFSDRAAAE